MKSCPKCGKSYAEHVDTCPDDNTRLTAEEDPLLGKLIAGRFLITAKIGQGGMGAVYKAIQTKIDRPCAVKLLTSAATDSAAAVSRFNREAQLASRIDSPHAVTIYDFGESETGALYLAMEFIDGEPLGKILARERPLPLERVAHIVAQIAEALTAAHAIGIVHRDLKPDNIMITHKASEIDYVKVLDFGIAKAVSDDAGENLTQTGFVLGTPVYMSPEQLSGDKLDPRSDVYSLALITYEMLTGCLPFEGDNAQAIMIKRVTSEPAPLRTRAPWLSEVLERVVMEGLARDPAFRTPSAERFATKVRAAATPQAAGESQVRLGRETVPDIPVRERLTSAEKTVSISTTDTGERPPTEQEAGVYPPPSAYVTRASTAKTGPASYPARPGAEEAHTLPIQSGLSHPLDAQLTVLQEPAQSRPDAAVRPGATRPARNGVLIAMALISIVGIVAAAVAGYIYFSRDARNQNSKWSATDNTNRNEPAELPTDLEASAREHYEKGLSHQEQARRLAETGSRAEAIQEHKKAIEECRRAIALRPVYPEAREVLGISLFYTGELSAAVDQYRTAIAEWAGKATKPSAQLYSNYGLALFDLGRFLEAAEAFGHALEIKPDDFDLYAHRGFALQNAGDLESAKRDYNRYLQLAPSGDYVSDIREMLRGRLKPPVSSGQPLVTPENQ